MENETNNQEQRPAQDARRPFPEEATGDQVQDSEQGSVQTPPAQETQPPARETHPMEEVEDLVGKANRVVSAYRTTNSCTPSEQVQQALNSALHWVAQWKINQKDKTDQLQ